MYKAAVAQTTISRDQHVLMPGHHAVQIQILSRPVQIMPGLLCSNPQLTVRLLHLPTIREVAPEAQAAVAVVAAADLLDHNFISNIYEN